MIFVPNNVAIIPTSERQQLALGYSMVLFFHLYTSIILMKGKYTYKSLSSIHRVIRDLLYINSDIDH